MEREKQKCAEKERERQDHAALLEQRRLAEKAVSSSSDAFAFSVKSKFVSQNVPRTVRIIV